MRKCKICGRSGLLLKLNQSGCCNDCESRIKTREYFRQIIKLWSYIKSESPANTDNFSVIQNKIQACNDFSELLDHYTDYQYFKQIIDKYTIYDSPADKQQGIGWIKELSIVVYTKIPNYIQNVISQLKNGAQEYASQWNNALLSIPHSSTTLHSSDEPLTADSVQDNIDLPDIIDGCPLAYSYNNVPVSNANFELALSLAHKHQWKLSARKSDAFTQIIADDQILGIVADDQKSKMLTDWIEHAEPYLIYLDGIDVENKKISLFLAFYRDKRTKLSCREHTTVRLTNFSNEETQFSISFISEGAELELSISCDINNDSVYTSVQFGTSEIGRLPKKISDRYVAEGAMGCFFEHIDYDCEKDKNVPVVTIYW